MRLKVTAIFHCNESIILYVFSLSGYLQKTKPLHVLNIKFFVFIINNLNPLFIEYTSSPQNLHHKMSWQLFDTDFDTDPYGIAVL